MHTAVEPCNLAVVDDHPAMRHGLAAMLATWPHGRVVLVSGSGPEYAAAVPAAPPIHMALVDHAMPGWDGPATLRWMAEHQPHTLPLVLCAEPQPQHVHAALLAGARAVLCKSADVAELHTALDHLRSTGHHHNHLVQQVLQHPQASGSALALQARARKLFSPRQLQFLRLYLREEKLTLKQIAQRMGVSYHTVESFRRQVVDKTGAHNRYALLLFAQRFGVV